MDKSSDRATVPVYALEVASRAGDREIRMRPIPLLNQGRPCKESQTDV